MKNEKFDKYKLDLNYGEYEYSIYANNLTNPMVVSLAICHWYEQFPTGTNSLSPKCVVDVYPLDRISSSSE